MSGVSGGRRKRSRKETAPALDPRLHFMPWMDVDPVKQAFCACSAARAQAVTDAAQKKPGESSATVTSSAGRRIRSVAVRSRERSGASADVQSTSMNCPSCGLFNTEVAERCDCGHALREGVVSVAVETRARPRRRLVWSIVLTCMSWALAIPIGTFLTLFVMVWWLGAPSSAEGGAQEGGFALIGLVVSIPVIALLGTAGTVLVLVRARWGPVIVRGSTTGGSGRRRRG